MLRPVFTPEDRQRVRDHILTLARADARIISGATVGSDARGRADRWSDLDLTFGVAGGTDLHAVLGDWTVHLDREFNAVHLFDVPSHATMYRVFLLPGNLQVDLSFTPGYAADYGPGFRLLFGDAVKRERFPPPPATEVFGLGVHHAVRARFSIERNRPWQAEYWIRGARDQGLELACLRRGLDSSHGRGYDQLPAEVLELATSALVRSLDRIELLRALGDSVHLLVQESEPARELARQLAPQLADLTATTWP
jgi:hypothetical protein